MIKMEEHIVESKQQRNLKEFYIDPEVCKGCGLCRKKCPTEAVIGEKKGIHVINQENCIQCGVCLSQCKFSAVKTQEGASGDIEMSPKGNGREMASCPYCDELFTTRKRIVYILEKTKGKAEAKFLCDRCRKKELVKKLVKYYS